MYVNEAMSADVKVGNAKSNLEEISRLMWENDCGAIPIVNTRKKPIGIVTDRDIAMAAMLNHQPLWEIEAGTLLKEQRLCSCHQDEPLEDCLMKMEQNGVRRMPVVSEDGRLAGIVSMGDILAFTPQKAGNRKQKGTVAAANVIGMLKRVTGHHEQPVKPVAIA